jgi:hypothetical protein
MKIHIPAIPPSGTMELTSYSVSVTPREVVIVGAASAKLKSSIIMKKTNCISAVIGYGLSVMC